MKAAGNNDGFTYITVLTVVMIMGIMLGMAGQSWKTFKQRELEEEMIFRGDQIAEIVYQRLDCMGPKTTQYLWSLNNSPNGTILDDLVIGKEEGCPTKNNVRKKYRIRPSAIIDPMTNKPWRIVSPLDDATRFAGVASDSTKEPFKKKFRNIYDSNLLDEKKQYSEWLFTWELKMPAPQNPNPAN